MNKVETIDVRKDKNGNDMKVVTFEGATKMVYVNSKYDSNYDSVVVGAEFELEVDGNFLKIKSDKPGGGSRSGMMTKVMNEKRENIAHAMDKKELSIKISSTFRDATLIVNNLHRGLNPDEFKEHWNKWRAWLWEQYDKPLDRKWMEDNTDPLS